MAGETGVGSVPMALPALPEEVWEMILDELKADSQDILNVWKVFPELGDLCHRNKFRWFVDKVMPFLQPWLSQSELLTCRQVSKRWQQAADTHLDKSEIVEFEIYDDVDIVDDTQLMYKFIEHMGEDSTFIGRSLIFSTDCFYDALQPFEHGALKVLQKFGGHVWMLAFWLHGQLDDDLKLYVFILEALRLVPNLKGLKIYIGRSPDESQEGIKFLRNKKNAFPPLPQLEFLDLPWDEEEIPSPLSNTLMKRYSKQLKKLNISHNLWSMGYSNMLPEITELSIKEIGSRHEEEIQPVPIMEILHSLSTPKLVKLRLKGNRFAHNQVNMESAIVSCIRPFRQLEHIIFEELEFSKSGQAFIPGPLPVDSIPTLKSICIRGSNQKMNLAFLRCFPFLECLELDIQQFIGRAGRERSVESVSFENVDMYQNHNLWKMNPKLKKIVAPREEGPDASYSRAMYDWLHGQNAELEDLLECFNSMLTGEWGLGESQDEDEGVNDPEAN